MSETPKDDGEAVDPKTTLPPDYKKVMEDTVKGTDGDGEKEEGKPVKNDTIVPTNEYLVEFTRRFVEDQARKAQIEKAKNEGKVIIPLEELRKQVSDKDKKEE